MISLELTRIFIDVISKYVAKDVTIKNIIISDNFYVAKYCKHNEEKAQFFNKQQIWQDITLYDIWHEMRKILETSINATNIIRYNLCAGENQLLYNMTLDKDANNDIVYQVGSIPYEELEKIILNTTNEHPTVIQIIKEGKVNPCEFTYNPQACACDCSYITNNCYKDVIYENKKSNIKYQSLIKGELNIDTKFTNRFYKEVDRNVITIHNYENNLKLTFFSMIEGVDRKYYTEVRDEESKIIYKFVVSDTKDFIKWVNSLTTFNYDNLVLANKVSPNFELKQIVYFVSQEATIDGRIFNELWDFLTPEQRTEYLMNNVEKQNLVRKGAIQGINCDIYNKNVKYVIYDFNTRGIDTSVPEYKVFETTDDAIHYLVNEYKEKNKKD